MNRQSLLAFATGLLALAAAPSHAWSFENWSFEDYRVASPIVRDNLAVYLVHGNGNGTTAPLPLEQALTSGAAKIYELPKRPIEIENLSDRGVFIQMGTLLTGGLQDQVVAQDTFLPPRSGRMPLEIFCVDPFRSTARGDEDPTQFSSVGALFPSRIARLIMLTSSADTKAIEQLRQSGLWWSIDTVRSQLARRVGEPLEPPHAVAWPADDGRDIRPQVLLRARQSSWRTSLPLALENRRLADLQSSYLGAFSADVSRDDVIGAVFAINGRIEGAEIYRSPELFGRMWPNILRAYATQAIAASGADTVESPPPISEVNASLAAAQGAKGRALTSAFVVRENDAAILTEAADLDGNWIHRSLVPKLALAGSPDTPDALVARILQSGEVEGRSVASLRDTQAVVLRSDGLAQWSAGIAPSLEVARDLAPAQWPEWERAEAERALMWLRQATEWRTRERERSDVLPAISLAAFGIGLVVALLRRAAPAVGRGVRLGARALAAALAQAATLVTDATAALAIAVVATLAALLRIALWAAAGAARLRRRPLPAARPAFALVRAQR